MEKRYRQRGKMPLSCRFIHVVLIPRQVRCSGIGLYRGPLVAGKRLAGVVSPDP